MLFWFSFIIPKLQVTFQTILSPYSNPRLKYVTIFFSEMSVMLSIKMKTPILIGLPAKRFVKLVAATRN